MFKRSLTGPLLNSRRIRRTRHCTSRLSAMVDSTASESACATEPSAYLFPAAFIGSGSAPTASTTRSSVSLDGAARFFEELAGARLHAALA